MKTPLFLIVLLMAACVSRAAEGDLAVTDDLSVTIEDKDGNYVICGRLADHLKMHKDPTQAALNSKLLSVIEQDKDRARQMIKDAKDQGAQIPSEIEESAK